MKIWDAYSANQPAARVTKDSTGGYFFGVALNSNLSRSKIYDRFPADYDASRLYYMLQTHSFIPRKSDPFVRDIAEAAGQYLWKMLYKEGSFSAIEILKNYPPENQHDWLENPP